MIMLALCGCSAKRSITPNLNNISFIVEICYENDSIAFDSVYENNVLTLTATEPIDVKGLIISVNKNGLKYEFMGNLYNYDYNNVSLTSPLRCLFDVFSDVEKKNEIAFTDNNYRFKGDVNDYQYSFDFSSAGLPIQLEVNKLKLSYNFSNVTIIRRN